MSRHAARAALTVALALLAGCAGRTPAPERPVEPGPAPAQATADTLMASEEGAFGGRALGDADSLATKGRTDEPPLRGTLLPPADSSSAHRLEPVSRSAAAPGEIDDSSTAADPAGKSAAPPDSLAPGDYGYTPPDSLAPGDYGFGARLRATPADSARPDSTVADSLAAPKRSESDLDTSIVYGGERISFDVPRRTSIIEGRARIVYKDMTLTAYRIEVDWRSRIMTATPRFDTLYTDSTETEIDTVTIVEKPTFIQGQQSMEGMLMKVNMETKQGYIEVGQTKYEEGTYEGAQIQKVTDEILFVKDGWFTPCDITAPPPLTRFTGSQMKMVYKDKVVGKPVVMRFEDVPVAALPFFVFSVKSGRRSGIIIPTYGDNSRQGRHLRNLGYYWAASDYWDLTTTLDFYERTGILMRGDLDYKLRNSFSGNLSGSFNNQAVAGGRRGIQWDARARHNQQFGDRTRFNVDGTFISSPDYYDDLSNNPLRRLDQKLRSNATVSHRFESFGGSMSANLSHQENLATGENSQTLPQIQFSLNSFRPFPSAGSRRDKVDPDVIYAPPEPRRRPGERIEEEEADEDRFYHNISLSYNSTLENRRDESREISGDESSPLVEEFQTGWKHRIGVNAPQKVLRYFTVNPSASYTEDWLFDRREWFVNEQGEADYREESGFFQRRTFSTSLSANTKFYGYFPVHKLGLGDIHTVRHVVTPTLSMSYQPDFSEEFWGYFEEVTGLQPVEDDSGNVSYEPVSYVRDRYQSSFFGSTSSAERLAMNGSINNLFQMKRVKIGEEGEEEEIKSELFTYNLNTSYNFIADSLKFSDLRASFRASPISGSNALGPLSRLAVDLSTSHSFYQYDHEADRVVDEYYWENPDGSFNPNLIRMTSFSANASFSLAGANPFTAGSIQISEGGGAGETSELAGADTLDMDGDGLIDPGVKGDDRFDNPFARGGTRSLSNKPWSVSGSMRYQLSMRNPIEPQETIRASGTFTLKLTPKWDFSYNTTLDLVDKDVVAANLTVSRDLGCWQGRFTWSPMGIGQGFFLYIGMKASMLRDIKIEQQRGRGSFGGY